MNHPLSSSQVFLVVEPVDIHKGADGLSHLVQQPLGKLHCDSIAYAFRNRSGTRIKPLVWDGTGVSLCVRSLHKGRFTWLQCNDNVITVS